MKTRMPMIVTMTLLLLPGVLWSMEAAPSMISSEPIAPIGSNAGKSVMVFRLEYCPAATAVDTLTSVFGPSAEFAADTRTNSIVVTAMPNRMAVIQKVVKDMDRPIPSLPPTVSQDNDIQTRIYPLRYNNAEELTHILGNLLSDHSDVRLVANPTGNQVLVSASPAEQKQVSALIQSLDTPPIRQRQGVQMMCRVYMLELPPANPDFMWFSITLAGTGEIPAESVVSAMQYPDLQIRDVSRRANNPWQLRIEGRAPSQARVLALAKAFPDAQIANFHWEDNSATVGVKGPEYQASQPLQEHLQNLLGKNLQTVGYWFGDLSLPGTIRAPIGPWTLQLDVIPEQGDELSFTIGVEAELPDGQRSRIIANDGRSRIGKPIIIGYNRDRDDTRTMGALVIIPEPADPAL